MKFRVALMTFAFGLAGFWFFDGITNGVIEKSVTLPTTKSEEILVVFPRKLDEMPFGGGGGSGGKIGEFHPFRHDCMSGYIATYFDWEGNALIKREVTFNNKKEAKVAFEKVHQKSLEILSPVQTIKNSEGKNVKSVLILVENNKEYAKRTGTLTHIEKIEYEGKPYFEITSAPTLERLLLFEKYLKKKTEK